MGMFNASAEESGVSTIGNGVQDSLPEAESVAKSEEVPAKELDQGGNIDSGQAETLEAKDDPQRMQFWQSRADKYKSELDSLKSQEPVLKYLSENPEKASQVYDVLLEKGSSNNVTEAQPVRPERPQKPASYNVEDAIGDPTSDSYKYKQAMEDFQMKLIEYQDEVSLYNEKKQNAERHQMIQVQQQQQALQSAIQEAMYVHGMDNKTAQEFVSWAQNPNYGMSDLIQVFKAQKGANAAAQRQAQNINSRVQAVVPPSVNGSNVNIQQQAEPQKTDGEAFFEGVFNYAKGRR
jgi:hypothetical protein